MIDTHSHLYAEAFDADRAEVVARDRAAGVEAVLLPGVRPAGDATLWQVCRDYPGYCFPMVGLHPTEVNELPDFRGETERIARLLENPPMRIYAVGETGLDLHWDQTHLAEQIEAFEAQIALALRYDLPLSLHAREAWEAMHAVLSKYSGRGLRGVMHAFSGTLEDYERVKSYGDFRFGIGGVVTYKNNALAAVVARMDLADIVLETDAPYLPPTPHRGQRCESWMMRLVMERIADLQATSPEEVERVTSHNARKIFAL